MNIKNALRLWEWWLLTAVLILVLLWLSPAQGPVLIYKLVLVTTSFVIGYWGDRGLFRNASFDRFLAEGDSLLAGRAMQRRALIVAAVILGMTMGL